MSICITIRSLSLSLQTPQQLLGAPDSGPAEAFRRHTRFRVVVTCQCAQNCRAPLKALDAMCNSFNTRLCRYCYHWGEWRAHATLHPTSLHKAAGNSFNLFRLTHSVLLLPASGAGMYGRLDAWLDDGRVMSRFVTKQKVQQHPYSLPQTEQDELW